jgi:hypothetical protein
MAYKRRPVVLLERCRGGDYSLSIAEGKETVRYYGKISLLTNKVNHYAIVYEREIPALSGPPGKETQLLLSGSEENFEILGRKNLEELTLNAALTEAKRIANKEGLIVRRKL